jgi:hypothetical protein
MRRSRLLDNILAGTPSDQGARNTSTSSSPRRVLLVHEADRCWVRSRASLSHLIGSNAIYGTRYSQYLSNTSIGGRTKGREERLFPGPRTRTRGGEVLPLQLKGVRQELSPVMPSEQKRAERRVSIIDERLNTKTYANMEIESPNSRRSSILE